MTWRQERFAWWHAVALLVAAYTTLPVVAAASNSFSVQPGLLRLTDIRGRERLKIRLLDEQCLEGTRDVFATSGRLRLESRPGDIAVDSIAAMWVEENLGTRAATHGAFLGLLAGGILAWQTDNILYAFFVPLAGGIAGSLTGSKISHWEPVQLQGDLPDPSDSPCDPTNCLPCELARLRPGNRVRVEATGGRYLEGESGHSSAEAVFVLVGLQTDSIARADIQRLWVKRSAAPKSAAVGIKIMAPIGAIAGGLLFGALSQWCWEACSERRSPVLPALLGALTGGAFGAVLGGLFGAGVGAPFHSWVQLYP